MIEKYLSECLNVSVKFLCALLVYLCLSSGDPFIVFGKSIPFFIPFFVYLFIMGTHMCPELFTTTINILPSTVYFVPRNNTRVSKVLVF